MRSVDVLAKRRSGPGAPTPLEVPPDAEETASAAETAHVEETARLAALRRYQVLDTPEEPAFDDLTMLAAEVCQVPMALVGLMDADRQWLKSKVGLDMDSWPREVTFCRYAMNQTGMLVVPDATLDDRFAANPMVTGGTQIRFYAGVPLIDEDGYTLGTLCVLDVTPRQLTGRQAELLGAVARQVLGQLSLRRKAIELADSQRVLQGVIDHSDALIHVKDLDGRFTLANQAVHDLLGLAPAAAIGLGDQDLPFGVDVDAEERRAAEVRTATTVRREVSGEVLRHRDGTLHDYLATRFPLRDGDGDVYAVATVATDVTILAEQRRLLAESEARWRALVEHSPVAVAVIDDGARFAYANPCATELYGAGDGTIVGRQAADLVPEGAHGATAEMFGRVLQGDTILGSRWVLRRLDGRLVEVEINAAAVEYAGLPAVQVELRDMTVQVQVERALRESERRWRAVFDGSPVGIALADEHGVLVAGNAAFCALLGRSEEDVLGRRSVEFTHPGDLSSGEEADALITAAADGVAHIEKRYIRPDGEVRWAWLTIAHTLGSSGETWTLAHVQDVTARRRTEEAVRQSEANLTAVAKVAQEIQAGGDARQTIVHAGLQLAEAGYVSLLEPDAAGTTLLLTASTNPALVGTQVPIDSASATAGVFRTGASLLIADPGEDRFVSPALLQLTGARSVYIVPVRSLDQVSGVLVVGWDHRVPDLDDRRAAVVTLLADQAGAALRQAALVAELESLATTDPLTTLPNRRGWEQLLAESLVGADRSGAPLTVALADIDHFKRFNDAYGHPAGDELLCRVGRTLRDALRTGDVAARWGGEEFAIALPQCPPTEAASVFARIREGMPGEETFSIGVVTWDGREDAARLMQRADLALYAAKTGGRDRIVRA